MEITYTFAGFLVGFIIGMTGVGGGSLMTPILVFFFGIKPAIAVGTDLLYAAITKSSGILVHHRNKTVDWKIVGLMALGSIPSSLLSVLILKQMNAAGINHDRIITLTLSVALILTSMALLFKERLKQFSKDESSTAVRTLHQRFVKPVTVLAGALIGVLVTFSSVGAGALGAAFLLFLYPQLRAISIVGTDLAHAVPITTIAGLGHAHIGTVDYLLLGSLVIGSLPGIYLGSHMGKLLPDRIIRPLLACLLLLIGIRMAVA
ncbi:MAG: putative rane transporter protein [Gammaproteobacteria bacterium]|nr:putative rane transporter protein [Gammaproteobacteria bacterium]